MTRQSFFADTPASRMLSQFELVFDYVAKAASSAADRAQLLKEIRSPQPRLKTKSHPHAQQAPAQLELSLTQPEPVNANAPSAPALAPAPTVAKKPRAKETRPRKRNHRLIIAAGMSEQETSAIISEEEWAEFVSAAPVHQRGDKTRQPYAEPPYRPSIAKNRDEKPHVSLSSGVGAIFDASIWGSMNDGDVIDPVPAHRSCRGLMSDGQFGCNNPRQPGKSYCKEHHKLYWAKSPTERNLLDAAFRKKQTQYISYEEMNAARIKRSTATNAGKGAAVLARFKERSREFRLAAAE